MNETELLDALKDRRVAVRREAAGNANATEAVLRVTALDRMSAYARRLPTARRPPRWRGS